MSDDADRADAEIERAVAEALRQRRPAGPAATGFCLYCGEPLPATMRWCLGTECAAEYCREAERRAANGG